MERFPYLLEAAGDDRDMAPAIEQILSERGACILGAGVFYVSGVTMPHGTTLMGLGNATVIVLKKEVSAGAAVSMDSFCTVKDLTLVGEGEDGIPAASQLAPEGAHGRCERLPDDSEMPAEIGTRHGILFASDADRHRWQNQPHNSTIENCRIFCFTGGGITCRDTGYSINACLNVSDCHIRFCGAGIYIPHYSEFHKFTNVLCCDNLYGCINNGGNNVFVNCGFDANKTGFVIDNRDGNAWNNAHGSAIGCTFHHSDHNNGVGIALYGVSWGFVFSGGQIGASDILIENSKSIVFSGMNILGERHISVKGPTPVLFCGNVFHKMPVISLSGGGRILFSACYTTEGEEVK